MDIERLLKLHEDVCRNARDIMTAKNHDYRGASGDPFANFRGSEFLGIEPIVGILLRIQDKMQRIKTFSAKGELAVKDEPVSDAICDIINYAILLAGMIEEEKQLNHEP